jgi:2-polyprenyl-3-methyl-5-hydroxy-6-metoxy-1,4-benzoquinol methylase
MSIDYSDGEIEGTILELVEASREKSSLSAIAQERYSEWPIRYHLCPERANLFRHLDLEGLEILELGAGMGAASRHLAERASFFMAVEGTESRLNVLKSRLSDLDNWDAVQANIEDYRSDRKFDVVCLIGVVEYAELYINPPDGESPFLYLLAHATSFLKPDGVLIVAIENRNGIKYWAGAPEDHTGQMFDGICGYSTEKTPRTFSRLRFLNFLRAVGHTQIEEYFPWPDYKIPQAVVTKRLIDSMPELASDIAADSVARDANPPLQFFPTALAAKQIIYSGMLADMSNSFLFVASPKRKSETLRKVAGRTLVKEELAWHYSLGRQHPLATVFSATTEGPVVNKRFLTADSSTSTYDKVVWNELKDAKIIDGAKISNLLKRIAYFDGKQAFEDFLVGFLDKTLAQWQVDERHLVPEALDAIPQNAVQEDDGSFSYFDLEWTYHQPIEKEWLVFRSIFCDPSTSKVLPSGSYESLEELYEVLCRRLNLKPDLERMVRLEAAVQGEISGEDEGEMYTRYLAFARQRLNSDMFPRNPEVEGIIRQTLGEEAVGEKLQELQSQVQTMNSLLNRRSVKLALAVAQGIKRLKPGSKTSTKIPAWLSSLPLMLPEFF